MNHTTGIRVRDCEPGRTATFHLPTTSMTSISGASVKSITSWLENIEQIISGPKKEVQSVSHPKPKPESKQAPEPESTRKRKRSTSLHRDESPYQAPSGEKYLKKYRHTLQYTMAEPARGEAPGPARVSLSVSPASSSTTNHTQRPISPAPTSSSTAETPSTPANSTVFKIKAPTDAGWVGRRMESHGLLQDRESLHKYPDFKKTIMEVINGSRYSHMRPESAQAITKQLEYYQRTNEATILNWLLPLIIKDGHRRKKEPKGSETDSLGVAVGMDGMEMINPKDGEVYGSKSWFDDGVVIAVNKDLRKDLLPHRYADEHLALAMRKDDNMLTPRPDRCFGLLPNWIPVSDDIILSTEIRTLIEACPDMDHSFFILEGKSNDGSVADAENQARRGGATLVQAERQLLSKVGQLNTANSGPDDRTFVFSATMAPNVIDLWVHWAEMRDGSVLFNMSWVKSAALRDEEQLVGLRKTLHNIMSWGCDIKARRLQELHNGLHNWQRRESARVTEELQNKAKRKRPRLSDAALI